MRTTRIFLDKHLVPGQKLALDAEATHYLSTVLRLRVESELLVFNPGDGEFNARITAVTKHALEIELGSLRRQPEPVGLSIHLGLGISRGDRMDFAIQKSTELGVTRITPLYSRFGEVKLKADRVENKLRHWNKVATSAAEQCGRLDLPVIAPPVALEDWQQTLGDTPRLLLDPAGDTSLSQIDAPTQNQLALVIGPEGGFAEEELDWGRRHGFTIVSLGTRILRTETAPIAALAILQHRFGDM